MTVKDLIQHLKEWDPNAEVRIGKYCGNIDWRIKGISVYILSPLDNQNYVYLRCEENNYHTDNIPHISQLLEKN